MIGSRKTAVGRRITAVLLIFILLFTNFFCTQNTSKVYAEAETNEYVEDIQFPIVQQLTGDGIEGYKFSKNQLEYNIVLPDSRYAGIVIKCSQQAVEDGCYYRVRLNGKNVVGVMDKKVSKNNNIALLQNSLKNCKIGQTNALKITVGKYDSASKQFDEDAAVTYTYNITKSLTLKTFEVRDKEGVDSLINPVFDSKAKPYQLSYSINTLQPSVKLALEATNSDTEIKIGDDKYDGEKWYLVDSFSKNEDGQVTVPITVRYTGEGTVTVPETKYTLIISQKSYAPIITKQSDEFMTVQKADPKSMSVEASCPEGTGELSYEWYKFIGQSRKKINEASTSEYVPPIKYAGTTAYQCVVTNTVNKTKYQTLSRKFKYTVDKDSLTAPEFITHPKVYEHNNSTKFYCNGKPTIYWETISDGEKFIEGIPYRFDIYTSETNSMENATIVDGCSVVNKGHRTVDSTNNISAKNYIAMLPSQNVVGDRYYFIKASVSENGKTDEIVSDPLKLSFVDPASVVKLEGKGTENEPFLIKTVDDLRTMKALVEGTNGNDSFDFSGQNIKLCENIELPDDWAPIGNLKPDGDENDRGKSLNPFSGVFDGNGHLITIADHGKPLFKYVRRATVKNLNIQGKHVDSNGLVDTYVVDYGEEGEYVDDVEKLRTIDIENVTIKEGTNILKSGFISGVGSGVNAINIRNCKIEKNVIIGYDKTQSYIGSFAAAFNGTVESSVSYATVYGVDQVGGLIGSKGQSMGPCDITNSAFLGTVEATGNHVGGILGKGYGAPGTPVVQIHNCYVNASIMGKEKIGGILGDDSGHKVYNDTGDGYNIKGALAIGDNVFYGSIKGEGQYVGGIIGCLNDFTKKSGTATNYFLDSCGTLKGIGGTLEGVSVGEEKHSQAATEKELSDGTILNKLNSSKTSYKNWIQGEKHPVLSEKPVVTRLRIEDGYKTRYLIGENLELNGMKITAFWSDGKKKILSEEEQAKVEIIGFNSATYGTQVITLKYEGASTEIKIAVLKPDTTETPKTITVSFALWGDRIHNCEVDKEIHTLTDGNLQQWIKGEYTVGINSTVKDVFEKALTEAGYSWRNKSGNYVQGITPKDGKELAEFTNGKKSGWMYTLNGSHPVWGVAEQYLNNNDVIVFHYTDDFTKEEGSDKWGTPGADEAKDVTTSGSGASTTTKSPTEVTVSNKTNADGTTESTATVTVKKENQEEIIKQAKENNSKEIVLDVAASDSKGADNIQLELPKDMVNSIVKDTQATVTVKSEQGEMTIDKETLAQISKDAKGATVVVNINKAKTATEEQKKLTGENTAVYKLTIMSGNEVISQFNGKITVKLPIPAVLLDKTVAAVHFDSADKFTVMDGKRVTEAKKDYYVFDTTHFSEFGLVDAKEAGITVDDNVDKVDKVKKAKKITSKMKPTTVATKTKKKNVKVNVKMTKKTKTDIKALKDLGYNVKYSFYRSTKKSGSYKVATTKKANTYTYVKGKKAKRYYYKTQIRVYDNKGKLITKTTLKNSKYASRVWAK